VNGISCQPAIWADLKKHQDRASQEATLLAFFDDSIADDTESSPLRHFSNQAFFDDIITTGLLRQGICTTRTCLSQRFQPNDISTLDT
jgi:hypothetical protein